MEVAFLHFSSVCEDVIGSSPYTVFSCCAIGAVNDEKHNVLNRDQLYQIPHTKKGNWGDFLISIFSFLDLSMGVLVLPRVYLEITFLPSTGTLTLGGYPVALSIPTQMHHLYPFTENWFFSLCQNHNLKKNGMPV